MGKIETIKVDNGAVYIELNGWTYYIDDTTDEQIVDKWRKPDKLCCCCQAVQGDVDELLVEGWVTFCKKCFDEIEQLQENTDEHSS